MREAAGSDAEAVAGRTVSGFVGAAHARVRGFVGWRLRVWLVSLMLVGLVLWPGRALAATGHAFVGGSSEAPLGTRLVGPDAVAVDRASGEVFVGDGATGYVNVFSAAGVYESRFGGGLVDAAGVAVDEASGDVYVVEPQQDVILVYEPDGEVGYRLLGRWSGKGVSGGGFGEVAGVAVDNSKGVSAGLVYVVESRIAGEEDGAVDVFRPKPNPEHPGEVGEGEGEEGQYLKRLPGPKLKQPDGVAVSALNGQGAGGGQLYGRGVRL